MRTYSQSFPGSPLVTHIRITINKCVLQIRTTPPYPISPSLVHSLSCVQLCDLPDCSTPGFPALHYQLELTHSCPLSQWCHPAILSSVAPVSSCFQSFPASESFPMSWLFASSDQSIGASVSASVLPMNIQVCFPLGLTGLCPRDSQESSPAPQFESISLLALSPLYGSTLISIHDYWKNHSLD